MLVFFPSPLAKDSTQTSAEENVGDKGTTHFIGIIVLMTSCN